MYYMIQIQNPVYYHKFRNIHAYSHPIQTIVAYLKPYITLAYSEPFHIQNSSISRTQDTIRTLSKHILAYGKAVYRSHIEKNSICRTLPYLEFWNIQDLSHIQNPVYTGTIRHIQAYLIIILIITLTFFFFHFHLTYFSTKFEKTVFFLLK